MILVTGGAGFLGTRLVQRLAERGEDMRLLVRDPSRAPGPAGVDVDIVAGDVTDDETLRRAVDGCDRVIHAAALVREWAPDPTLFDRVNVEAPLALLDAAGGAGVEKVVVVSSFIALGPSGERPATEEHEVPDRTFFNDYERTKTEGRRRLRERLGSPPALVIVYPGVIYGPGRKTAGNIMVRLILDHAKGKMPGLLGGGKQLWSYVHVDDVCDGLLASLDQPGGSAFVLGGDNVSQRDFWQAVSTVGGLPVLRRRIPLFAARAVAGLSFLRARLLGREPPMTPGAVRIFEHDWALDSSHAHRTFGYAPRSLEEGLGDTFAWLRREGDIPS
jgi:NAD+-dependent farnesol dehydrogenase